MKTKYYYLLFPPALLFLLLLDAQLTTSLTELFGSSFRLISHLSFSLILFISLHLSLRFSLFLFLGGGIWYDAYYFHIIGMATLLFPLFIFLIFILNDWMMVKRLRRLMGFLLLVFLFESGSFMIARLFSLTSLSFSLFLTHSLLSSLLFNLVLFLLFQPLLEKYLL